ncbi:hypothetical protein QQF64_027822 [Cirrhinus molitorella]|uniref:Uncharacterized protein n=1 Tax=Cirrhinus molitorella TaxID=172907 RepID=A0ABR3NDH3_9TELE
MKAFSSSSQWLHPFSLYEVTEDLQYTERSCEWSENRGREREGKSNGEGQSAARGRSLELTVVGYQPESSQSEVRKPDEPTEKRLLTATDPSQKSLRGRGSSVCRSNDD